MRSYVYVVGAVDRFVGHPPDPNPFEPGTDAHEGWAYGWELADLLLKLYGADEARHWLEEAA